MLVLNLWVEIFLKKLEHQKKGLLRLLFFTLCIRVSRKFYLHFCFKLKHYIQNGAKFLQKLTPGFKNQKFDGLLLSKKYIPSARILPKIYLTLLSATCVKFTKLPTSFLKPYISHFSRHSSSVFFLLKHYILSTKVAHQSANFQTFHCSG